jgi:hypothetical protein
MHSSPPDPRPPWSDAFAALEAGTDLGTLAVTVSAHANERYWLAAGVDHPLLRAGALYPPIATNLTVLLLGQRCPDAMIQTRQRLRCHRAAPAGVTLTTTGRVATRYEKRGRVYIDVHAVVHASDAPDETLWTSEVSFTPAVTLGATR